MKHVKCSQIEMNDTKVLRPIKWDNICHTFATRGYKKKKHELDSPQGLNIADEQSYVDLSKSISLLTHSEFIVYWVIVSIQKLWSCLGRMTSTIDWKNVSSTWRNGNMQKTNKSLQSLAALTKKNSDKKDLCLFNI